MAVTNLSSAFFVVYSRSGIFNEQIKFDSRVYSTLLTLATYFFDMFIVILYKPKVQVNVDIQNTVLETKIIKGSSKKTAEASKTY